MNTCERTKKMGGGVWHAAHETDTFSSCLPLAGDNADTRELVDEISLRDGGGQTGNVNAVVVTLLAAVLAAEKIKNIFSENSTTPQRLDEKKSAVIRDHSREKKKKISQDAFHLHVQTRGQGSEARTATQVTNYSNQPVNKGIQHMNHRANQRKA